MIGCDSDQISITELIEHVRKSFNMEQTKHQQLLDTATMKEEPCLKLNLEIHSAKNLIGKDISGNSDPFCTFYLSSNPLARNNTSYKPRTLNPTWNEEYALDVNSIEQDQLRLDVWDFNPEENVTEKFKKINEVKDGRGLRKLIKETLVATTGKHTHALLGSVQISLKSIPASGVSGWWNLEKPETRKQKERGEVRLTLTLSTEKDPNLSSQEHRHLLKIMFAYQLQISNAAPYTWNGEFARESVIILSQHAVQGKLTGADTALARWLVYCHTHCDLPLDY
ncbi:protein unc-13 homolog 4B, partial [Eurytemora carolleeae]|uniref:protein unc-13 homolog 4B n=1 Tax=Eurytemora carolleeae TaxID=1294199 RepID=UPI000C77154B